MWNSELSLRPISALRAPPRSYSHPEHRLKQLSSCVEAFGFATPILVDINGVIVAGQGRVEAARALGFFEIPCLAFESLSEDDKHLYFQAHQKLALQAGWDEALLAGELEGLLDAVTPRSAPIGPDGSDSSEDLLPVRGEEEAVTQPDDLWILGDHRLFCGDATSNLAYDRLMGGDRAQLVFTDPLCQADLASLLALADSGERRGTSMTERLTVIFRRIARYSSDDAVHLVCSDWRYMRQVGDAGESVFAELRNLIVWIKDPEGKDGLCGSGHELVFVFGKTRDGSLLSGGNGRDVWRHRGLPDLHSDDLGETRILPMVKPVALLADAIQDNTGRGDIVLDAFCGSGTMLLAAQKTARLGRAIEQDPGNCDSAILRWQNFTREQAFLAETGESFGAVEHRRTSGPPRD